MEKTFYSNGKLLITGEYLVLDGAKALALPTKFGQYLKVISGKNQEIQWTSFDKDKSIWFEDTISFSEIIKYKKIENPSVKSTLIEILHEAYLLNPRFINSFEGYTISTNLTFPKFWGLGTSSTLINNIAQWLQINAFELLKNSFGGSGYDIACAQNDLPIFYQIIDGKPEVEIMNFNPDFSNNLYFVYLNQKQNSKSAIAAYYKKQNNLSAVLPEINKITVEITEAITLEKFQEVLQKHENIMSEVLEIPTVKNSLFSDFNGTVKSLGAWGGDFVLVVSNENPTAYFKAKGFETIIAYSDMIL
ncbi:ERG12 Mevalonate kinase [Flavobacteriaceae bacterium]